MPAASPGDPSTWVPPPSRLHVPATASDVEPSVETSPQTLPLSQLSWENFERLCLRLLELDAEPIHVSVHGRDPIATERVVRRYGIHGQAQQGIDIFARNLLPLGEASQSRPYVCLQARRIAQVNPSGLRKSVAEFRAGNWSHASRKFIFATRASMASVTLTDEIEKLALQLVTESIEFAVWDQEDISSRLKEHPELVDDFFGREWAKRFCGDSAARKLGTRLDVQDVNRLRAALTNIYRATFGVADSGVIAFRFGSVPAIGLQDRFVTPDLVSTTQQAAALAHSIEGMDAFDDPDGRGMADDAQELLSAAATLSTRVPAEDEWLARRSGPKRWREESPEVAERLPADQLIGTQLRQVIVGEPGAGKSTLLRYLVLDLLSETPRWHAVAERWGRRLPVWLPFHFFTQRVDGQTGAAASVVEALRAWLEQHDSGHIWSLVKAALDDSRLLLVVDGLDEWTSDSAGKYALAALQTFAEARKTPMIASTRPYGLARLPLGAGWNYSRIALLTPDQQRQLASHYFGTQTDSESDSSSPNVIDRLVGDFLAQVHNEPDLRSLSGVPLFLVLLVGLRLSSAAQLPSGRFEVFERAVGLLVSDHPAQRRSAAAVTESSPKLSDRQLRTVLSHVAFATQTRGHFSALSEADLQRDFADALGDPDGLAMEPGPAASTADQLLNVAESDLGILVRRGPRELGFLHRGLQEQLAAEYVADRLALPDVRELFRQRIGDPRWREVLLAVMCRLNRPAELRVLVELIEAHVDESPTGLRARELLAEAVFGPCSLPSGDVRRAALDIIEAIETHPYGPHRARLLDSVLIGIRDTSTEGIVGDCLKRWTLLIQEPSPQLVREIAAIPPTAAPAERVRRLLVRALCNPVSGVAYTSAAAIAKRALTTEADRDMERDFFRAALLRILGNPPSALAASAALLSLAAAWRDDPKVVDALEEARTHIEPSIRVIALGDAVGVLSPSVGLELPTPDHDAVPINDGEREWLLEQLCGFTPLDSHVGLLLATISEALRGQGSVLDAIVADLKTDTKGPRRYNNIDLVWPVILRTFADDARVVDIICDQLASAESSPFKIHLRHIGGQDLAAAYPPESRGHEQIAAAIEQRLASFDDINDMELYGLAATDRGPMMKDALLRDLDTSSMPHWAADALTRYFPDDIEAQEALRATLTGEPVRASKIANVASRVLSGTEAVSCLIDALRNLRSIDNDSSARYDIVVLALAHAVQERRDSLEPDLESLAVEILGLVPVDHSRLHGYSRHEIVASLYPSEASKQALTELMHDSGYPIEPYLRAFRFETPQIERLFNKASTVLSPLPAPLRARICQSLAERRSAPKLVMELSEHWADEVADINKSVASLAYHSALRDARNDGRINDEEWNAAVKRLGVQASCYGPDHQARRRAAWVGLCVCADWSALSRLVETIGEPDPVGVSLTDELRGPDHILLNQVASCWQKLRSEFGDTLLQRLSGISNWETENQVWDALALVANQNATLEQELEHKVADEPDLLQQDGVLAWYVTRRSSNIEAVAEILVSRLGDGSERIPGVATILLAEPERIGLRREALRSRLEDCFRGERGHRFDSALGALALLDRDHPRVRDAWREFSAITDDEELHARQGTFTSTYLAVTYEMAQGQRILRHLAKLASSVEWHFDEMLGFHIRNRLRRDETLAGEFRNAMTDPETPEAHAALIMSLVASALGVDADFQSEIERRLMALENFAISPFVRDRTLSATLPVRSVLMRITDGANNVPST